MNTELSQTLLTRVAPATNGATVSGKSTSAAGLLGLVGLAGLAGLAGRKRHDDVRTYDNDRTTIR